MAVAGRETYEILLKVKGDKELRQLQTEANRMNRQMASMRRSVDTTGRRLQNFAKNLAKAGIAMAGLVVTQAMMGGLRALSDELDKISKSADNLGLGIEEIQELQFAFGQGGVDAQKFESTMSRLTNEMGEAAKGSAAAQEKFDHFGVSIRNANGGLRSSADVLHDVADHLASVPNDTERAALAMELFGRRGVELVSVLKDGSEGLEALRQQARDAGLVFEDDLARSAAEMNDKLAVAAQQIKVALGPALMQLMPILVAVAERFAQLVQFIGNAIDGITSFVKSVFWAGRNVGDWAQKTALAGNTIKEMHANLAEVENKRGEALQKLIDYEERYNSMNSKQQISRGGNLQKNIELERRNVEVLNEAAVALAQRIDLQEKINAMSTSLEDPDAFGGGGGAAAAAEQVSALTEALELLTETYEGLKTPSEVAREEMEKLRAALELLRATGNEDLLSPEMIARLKEHLADLGQTTESFADAFVTSFENTIGSAIDGLVKGTKTASEAFKEMAASIIADLGRIFAKQIATNLVTGSPIFSGFTFSADGNVFDHGRLQPFARGGIVTAPTVFPMAGSRMGIMGEAGPEAILPLSRGSGGKLGVEAARPIVNIINNSSAQITEEQDSEGNLNLTIDDVRNVITNDVMNGGSRVSAAFERTFGLSRGRNGAR